MFVRWSLSRTQVTQHTRFLWRPASHGPSQHMLAKGTLACQRESDPGHQDRTKGRQRDRENKTPVYPESTVMLSNTFLVKAVEAQANHTYSLGTRFLCLEAKISLSRWFSSVLLTCFAKNFSNVGRDGKWGLNLHGHIKGCSGGPGSRNLPCIQIHLSIGEDKEFLKIE